MTRKKENSTTRVTGKAQEALERILTSFETGQVPEAIAKVVLSSLNVPSCKWSLNNRVLMFLAGTQDARGVQQWREVGRFPKKGSEAFYILAPSTITKHEVDTETGEETEKRVITGFRCVPVFAVEDTGGKPIEYPDLNPPQPPPLYDVAQGWGINVKYISGNESYYGYYQPEGNQIILCTHDFGTFFHELAHAAYYQVNGEIKDGQDWRQEIIAELTAATLMHLYGQKPSDGFSYRYIRQYAEKAGKDVYRACLAVISDVGRCLELILNTEQKETVAEGESKKVIQCLG